MHHFQLPSVMARIFSIIVCVTLIGLTGCDYSDTRLKITNQGKRTICFETAPDTLLSSAVDHSANYLTTQIEPGDSVRLRNTDKGGWPVGIGYNANHKLNLFVFNCDTISKYDYKFAALTGRELVRMSLSVEELEAMNWSVVVK